jgi:hypothetical protein
MLKYRFLTLEHARHFAQLWSASSVVILGDCHEFWVVSNADASKLIKQGYEEAPR